MSSVVAQWPVRMIAAPAITSKAPKTFSPRAMITGSLLPVDDAERQDARSPAALQLLGYASAAQRAASVSRLVPHALLRLLQPEDRLALGEGAPHPLRDRVRLFARERENIRQEGFNALVHRVSKAQRELGGTDQDLWSICILVRP